MASIRVGGHTRGSWMVFALLAFVARLRGAIGRAWALGRSRHRLALGPAVRPGVGSAPAQTAQDNKRLLAGGRDVRPGERQMGVLVPGRGLDRCDDRLPSLGQTRCSGGRALSDQSLGRGEPSRAAGHQHRQARCLPASHR